MQLQNFECQIAKAQIGRYLAGDALSDEAVHQLEAHVAKCPECKQNLAERRAVLQAMLSPTETPAQEVSTPKAKFDLAELIKSKLQKKQPVHAAVETSTGKPTVFTKPAMYSLALGVVLIGMSYASKNMGSLLGPKVAESQTVKTKDPAPQTIVKTAPIPTKTVAPTPKVTPKPVADASDLPVTPPKAEPAPEVKPAPAQPKNTRIRDERTSKRRHKRKSHKAPRPASDTIRVYAPEN